MVAFSSYASWSLDNFLNALRDIKRVSIANVGKEVGYCKQTEQMVLTWNITVNKQGCVV